MFTAPRTLPLISSLALWGLLASVPQTALGHGAQPVIRGSARLDAAVTSSNGGAQQRCLNDGSGGLTVCASFNATDTSFGIALGDVDGDGDLDAVVTSNSDPDQRCLNDGSSGFTNCVSFNTILDNTRSIALGDVNGDGYLDALLANNGYNEQRCLNDGSGRFANCASFNTDDYSYGIALGDVNGDGYLDALLANNGQVERRCLNDGSGNFQSGTHCASFNATDNSTGIALGDVNGDGDLDAVIANDGQAEQHCLNDGSGGFTNCASFNGIDNSQGIALGDVNGDGYLDAVIANDGQAEQRCLGNGSGGFTSCVSFNGTDGSKSIALGDVNGDGKLDAVIANFGGGEQRCLGNGSGDFTNCANFNGSHPSRSIALGDLKGDGPNGNLTDVTTRFVGGVTTSGFGLQTMMLPNKPDGLTALYQFDAKYCNQSATETLSNLRTRTVRITQNNSLRFEDFALPADKDKFLSAPEWREGGIGAELVIPTTGQTFGYDDGLLDFGECAVITYKFNLFSLGKYRFAVRLYGVATAADALPDSLVAGGSANDLNAAPVTEIELDLGALQGTTETPPTSVPPVTTPPGGTAPTPVTPVLSFPAGTSNLPSRH